MFSSLAVFAAFCGLMVPTSEAFSYGTGSCAAGRPAIGVEHLIGDPTTEITKVINGTLAQGKISLLLNGVPLTPGGAAFFLVGKDHNLTLASSTGYKGLLIRIGGIGTSALTTLPDDESISPTIFCIGFKASGVTHTSASIKKHSTALLRHDTPASNLPVDVTVVVRNIEGVSEFYYSSFILNAAASIIPAESTATPVAPTTPVVPSQLPTSKPSRRPTRPTRRPTRRPTKRPSRRPTKRPSRRPTVKPNL